MESTIARPAEEITKELKEPRAMRSLRHEARQRLLDTKENIREHPRQATLAALGAGMLLSFLPLATLVTAMLRFSLFLAKPALLILGGVKLVEEYRKSSRIGQA